jgi:23S rRNA (pseudouridine1915-N3)-methyltransferase
VSRVSDTDGLKLFVYFIGKPRDVHANGMAQEFVKRTSRYMACEMREIQPSRFDLFARHATARKVFLDPAGKSMSSEAFAALVGKSELEARDVVFLIGGHDGLPAEWRPKADLLLSLSAMTMPHELARAVLAEQIYRALTILRGHPYPR